MKASDGREINVGDVVWDWNWWARGTVVKVDSETCLVLFDELGLLRDHPHQLQFDKPDALIEHERAFGEIKRTEFTKDFTRGFIEGFAEGLEMYGHDRR